MADKDITFVVSIDGEEHHVIASATLVEALDSDDRSTRQHAYEYILSVLRQGKTSAGTPSDGGGGGGGGESLPENQRPEKDTSSTTWTRSQTLLLLELYKANVDKFNNPLLKKKLWEELCQSLNSKGYHFNSKHVEGRWKTIVAAYH
ncbi:uncharacterized protein LOC127862923 [Dreissena polymorpha]|uniref:Myb/SANT-like DNA-binding domain-containing protein n=1 Tax=Dreissena polymorpha TaxID=45954 RepID=A0A9D3Y946_DREPO|nr:uncharacterized protein LOC127862923 [Dreissena polymorpha]KAH3695547.1 hypothetical protein DPMN_083008 [Dreissena polymorpha]